MEDRKSISNAQPSREMGQLQGSETELSIASRIADATRGKGANLERG